MHTQALASFNVMDEKVAAELYDTAQKNTGEALKGLSFSDFRVSDTSSELSAGGSVLNHVTMQQVVNNVPVYGTYVNVSARAQDTRGDARLVASAHHVYHGVNTDTTPTLKDTDAKAKVRQALGAIDAELGPAKLMLYPTRSGKLELVYAMNAPHSPIKYMIHANGDKLGRIIRVDERRHADGNVRGQVAVGGAPGGKGVPTDLTMGHANVAGGDKTAVSDRDGAYVIEVADGTDLSASVSGPFHTIVDETGLAVSATAGAGTGVDLLLGDAANVLSVANVTTAHYASIFRDFLGDNELDVASFPHMTANTNIADACNAFYFSNSVNFFQAGNAGVECNNTAEATVIVHEMGHWIDDIYGGIQDGGLSEGWGDLLACLTFKASPVGGDLFKDEEAPLRDCKNDYQYPEDGFDEVHELGKAWAGFGWDTREGLIAALGEDEGDALARALIIPSLPSNAADIPAAVREVLLRDDDDGDITNGTPHIEIINQAAVNHGLGFVTNGDLTPPALVSDLRVTGNTKTTVSLAWTAPGDDGNEGVATKYDLRRSSNEITEQNFDLAEPLVGPTPVAAGETQELTVSVIPGTKQFFALKTVDENKNKSGMSNAIEFQAEEVPVLYAESFEAGVAGWTTSGLWHFSERKAAEGLASAWYGDETTGNYQTGDVTVGDLTSPEIDLTSASNPLLVYSTFFDVEEGAVFDIMTVTITDLADPANVVTEILPGGVTGGFLNQVLPLTAFEGKKVKINFNFNSVDNILNETEGWFIDDIRIFADGDAAPPKMMINEILSDPAPGFDSNKDGVVSSIQDEFIEMVNTGGTAVDMSGAKYFDKVGLRMTFPAGTIVEPGQALVIFGGGTPGEFEGAVTIAASGSLFLNNTGDSIRIEDASGNLFDAVEFGRVTDQSLVRGTDGDPNAEFVKHKELSTDTASPGLKTDGTIF